MRRQKMGESPRAFLPGSGGRAPNVRVRGAAWAGGQNYAHDTVPLVLDSVTICAGWCCAGGGEKRERWAGRKRTRGASVCSLRRGRRCQSFAVGVGRNGKAGSAVTHTRTTTTPFLHSCLAKTAHTTVSRRVVQSRIPLDV